MSEFIKQLDVIQLFRTTIVPRMMLYHKKDSPYFLDMAVFGTQETSQQLHDIIFKVIILQPDEQIKPLNPEFSFYWMYLG